MNIIEVFKECCKLIIYTSIFVMRVITDGKQIYISGLVNNYFIIAMYLVNLIFVLFKVVDEFAKKRKRNRLEKEYKKRIEAREKAKEEMKARELLEKIG